MHIDKYKKIIFLFFFIFFSTTKIIFAADLFIETSTAQLKVGDTLIANVYVDSKNQSINNVESLISVPSNILEIQSVSVAGSILNLWVEQPAYSENSLTLNGGIPNPGYTGGKGKVVTISMKAINTGTGSIVFQSANVRANDGLGTDVLKNKIPKAITVLAKDIVPVPPKKKEKPTATSTPEVIVTPGITLIKPRLLEMPQFLETGETLIVKGYVNPNINVLFEISGKKLNQTLEAPSDGEGFFEFSLSNIPNGKYNYFMRGVDFDGRMSEKSQIMNLDVGYTLFDKIIKFITQYIIYILIFIILILLILIIIAYHQIKKMKKKLSEGNMTKKENNNTTANNKINRVVLRGKLDEVSNKLNIGKK